MSLPEQLVDLSLFFRSFAIVLGTFCIWMGWTAVSQGYFWHSGYNARVGTETTAPTLSWIVYGALLVLAGLFPWKWLVGRRKR